MSSASRTIESARKRFRYSAWSIGVARRARVWWLTRGADPRAALVEEEHPVVTRGPLEPGGLDHIGPRCAVPRPALEEDKPGQVVSLPGFGHDLPCEDRDALTIGSRVVERNVEAVLGEQVSGKAMCRQPHLREASGGVF